MSQGRPLITVLLPAYNAAAVIAEAITSILGQTFADFELLIINDGSTDGTAERIAAFPDPRIRVLHHSDNQGLIATLNQGLALARGRYIARMDADDLALPHRFAWQYSLMEASPAVVACSGWTVDFAPRTLNHYNFREADHEALLARMIVEPPLSHPASFIRRSALVEHGLAYDGLYPHCEDYRLWFDLSKVGRLANVQKVLLRARLAATSVSQRHAEQQAAVARGLRREIITDFLHSRQAGALLPERITGATLVWFARLTDSLLTGIHDPTERRQVLGQLASIRYCLYMSQAHYGPGALLRFLCSGDWWRPGLRGLRTAKIVRKHWTPARFPALI